MAKYLIVYREYLDCPSCRGADGFPKSKVLNNLKELLSFTLQEFNKHEIEMVFRLPTGKLLVRDYEDCVFYYDTGMHNVQRIGFNYKGLHLVTADNGHGVRIWKHKD